MVSQRRQRHLRLARAAVAQDQKSGRGYALGQDFAAEHRGGLGLQQGVQRLQDRVAGGGMVAYGSERRSLSDLLSGCRRLVFSDERHEVP
jgi:hypothetical protein